jgi:hypothetical protein
MPTPRLATAFTLAFAVVVALACDEKAPTETRAPSEVSASAGEADGLAQRDASTMAIPLPVDQSVSTTSPAYAFRINQLGTGPNGSFEIASADNARQALHALTLGLGRAALFAVRNNANRNPAVEVSHNGPGTVGKFDSFFTGTLATNAIVATHRGRNGAAIHAIATNTGWAGRFDQTNPNSESSGFLINYAGRWFAAAISSTHLTARQPALLVTHAAKTAIHARGGGDEPVVLIDQLGPPPGGGLAFPSLVVNAGTSREAARFTGNVRVNGTLTKTAGSFRIDHPLDPEHKYLSHSFVESPDMMNVYNGNVTLDSEGRATVELPEYFEALNCDFRYQLTAIGAPGPNLYIAEGVQQNRFRIAGGRAYAHVSWQVTGVRQDAYANEHRIKVEEEKPLEEEKPPAEKELVVHR